MLPACRPEKAARLFSGAGSRPAPMRACRAAQTIRVIAMTNSATSHLLPVFARADLAFERGEGAWLIATNGDRYLDFTSGVAVNALGHAHPHLVAAVQEQATRLWHMSNLFKSPDGERLAARLCEQSFADFVFFCNSGAEAMECVIKMVRHHHFSKGHPERYRIITFEGAFHGRTLATLAATGAAKYLEGYGPPMDGFDQVPHGDIEAVRRAIGPHTAGILIEPVQGAARALRQARPAACLRRGADRHGPHRRAVRLQAARRHAGRDVARQGARRRFPDRRVFGNR
jgi:acetylornithine/N-succinyldiaminopimelate aminotransferase